MIYEVTKSCLGCGGCIRQCPDIFYMGEDGAAHARRKPVEKQNAEAAVLAMDDCPAGAIIGKSDVNQEDQVMSEREKRLKTLSEEEITRAGNPRRPAGAEGTAMLERMNESHYEVTGWGLSHWHIQPADRILDIGCGGGATLHRMAKENGSGSLTGLDYSEISLEASAANNAELLQSGRLQLVQGSVEVMPFETASFDKIVTVESFYFWPQPQENLREVRRVLGENGTFLLIADIYGGAELSEKTLANIQAYHMCNPSPQEFETYFQKAGFTNVRVHLKEGTTWICVEGHA